MLGDEKDSCGTSVEATTPLGSFKARGKVVAEIIACLSLSLALLYGYVLYEHKLDTVASYARLSDAIRDSAKAQYELAKAQREATCILSIPQDRRLEEYMDPYGYCRRITEMP